jgi:hypothetical protein
LIGEGDLQFVLESSAGSYQLNVCYALAYGSRPLDVYIYGYYVDSLDFSSTGSWSNWGIATLDVAVEAGEHVLSFKTTGSSGANIDSLALQLLDETQDQTETGADYAESDPSVRYRLEAEDYDAAFDNSIGNSGGQYRQGGVDIQQTSDVGGGFIVGWMRTGEWLEYALDLEPGVYQVSARLASAYDTGAFSLSLGEDQTLMKELASSGGWQNWETHDFGQLLVDDGSGGDSSDLKTLRLDVLGDRFNVTWLELERIETLAELSEKVTAGSVDLALASAMSSLSAEDSGDVILSIMRRNLGCFSSEFSRFYLLYDGRF